MNTKLVLTVMIIVLFLFGVVPLMAAEKCKDTKDPTEAAQECVIKAEKAPQTEDRIESEVSKGSKKYRAEQLEKLKKDAQEDSEILDELSKQ